MKLAKLLVGFALFGIVIAYVNVVFQAPVAQKAKGDSTVPMLLYFSLTGGTKSLSAFTYDLTINGITQTMIENASGTGTAGAPGQTYSIVLHHVDGYESVLSGCSGSGTFVANQPISCQITNTYDAAITGTISPTSDPTVTTNPTVTTSLTLTPTTQVTPTGSLSPTTTQTPTDSVTPTVTPTDTVQVTPTPTNTGNNCNNTDQSSNTGGNNNNNCNQQQQSQQQNQYNNNNQTVNITYPAVSYPMQQSQMQQLPSTGTPVEVWEILGSMTPLGFILRKITGK